ncbi:MAG: sigma-70 family RNA polymerase sigma factor [Anaerolineales bacterium]|jgi:RNA polymerase sigma-70 factor (ECF subfamily)
MQNEGPQRVAIERKTIHRALAGDESALANIYDVYAKPLYRYHYSRVGNAADAEDLTSQTFMAVMEALPSYRDRGRFTAWLFQIARNKAVDYFRSNPGVGEMTEAVADPTQIDALEAVYNKETRGILKSLLQSLDEEDRELLRLRFTAELSFVQMGHLLGRSDDAVRKAVRRILDRLAVQMEAKNV